MMRKIIVIVLLCCVTLVFLHSARTVPNTATADSTLFEEYKNKNIKEIERVIVQKQIRKTEKGSFSKISNLQKFKDVLIKGKKLSSYEAGVQLLKSMDYDSESIAYLPEETVLDALNYSEHYVETLTASLDDLYQEKIDDISSSNLAEARKILLESNQNFSVKQLALNNTQTNNSITFTTTFSIDKINRRIKHTTKIDCGQNALAYYTYSNEGIIMRSRGRQYISMENFDSKYSAQNNDPGFSFAMMSYDYHEQSYNLFTPNSNFDNSGRRYVYVSAPQRGNIYYSNFGFNLPGDDINVNSLLAFWIYEYSNFDFYAQYYTVYNKQSLSTIDKTFNQRVSYLRPVVTVNYTLDLSFSTGVSIGLGLQPSSDFNKTSVNVIFQNVGV